MRSPCVSLHERARTTSSSAENEQHLEGFQSYMAAPSDPRLRPHVRSLALHSRLCQRRCCERLGETPPLSEPWRLVRPEQRSLVVPAARLARARARSGLRRGRERRGGARRRARASARHVPQHDMHRGAAPAATPAAAPAAAVAARAAAHQVPSRSGRRAGACPSVGAPVHHGDDELGVTARAQRAALQLPRQALERQLQLGRRHLHRLTPPAHHPLPARAHARTPRRRNGAAPPARPSGLGRASALDNAARRAPPLRPSPRPAGSAAAPG